MGCGQSQVQPGGGDDRPRVKIQEQNGLHNGHTGKGDHGNVISSTDSNANWTNKESSDPVPKSVAFTVSLDGEQTKNSLLGQLPPRLKRLDPLPMPRLTAEQLAERQRQADEKREQQLERRASASVKSSRQRRQLQMAREFDQQQKKVQEKKINDSLKTAGETREAKLNTIKEKQQIRDERRKRAREKVKKLNELDQDVDIEKDETYNVDDEDSWLNDEIPDDGQSSSEDGEKIYGGRTSPKKRFSSNGNAAVHRGISHSTIDSYDNAYNRIPQSASKLRTIDASHEKDDFFDS